MNFFPLVGIALMATLCFSFGFYLVGLIFLLLLIFYIAVFLYLGNILVLFINMPTSWQNMSETMEIARKSGYKVDVTQIYSVSRIYLAINILVNWLFEISVNKKVVADFEKTFVKKVVETEEVQDKAIHYFTEVNKKRPDILLYIVNAIKVRKRFGLMSKNKERERKEVLN